jgi:hypothetical protein
MNQSNVSVQIHVMIKELKLSQARTSNKEKSITVVMSMQDVWERVEVFSDLSKILESNNTFSFLFNLRLWSNNQTQLNRGNTTRRSPRRFTRLYG